VELLREEGELLIPVSMNLLAGLWDSNQQLHNYEFASVKHCIFGVEDEIENQLSLLRSIKENI